MLLIAAPALKGTVFHKTVVFVLQHNSEGTFGVVLNQPANEEIKCEWHKLIGTDASDRFIVQGGPIGGPVFALHQEQKLAEMEMPGGVFVSAGSDKFQQLIDNDDSCYRIVFGVAGWQQGQLSDEIEEGLWYTLDGDAEQVFDDPTWMWEKSLRRYGQKLICDVIGIDRLPPSPLLN
jgi:putative transcriptional regulator